MAHALSVNKVPFAGSKGRSFTQSVRDLQAGAFQGKLTGKWARQMPPGRIQTLLLPVKHGSNGLNLTGGPQTVNWTWNPSSRLKCSRRDVPSADAVSAV